jgi:hypothetical protein
MSFSPLGAPHIRTHLKPSTRSPIGVIRTAGRFNFVKLTLARSGLPAWLHFDIDDKASARADILLGDGESLGLLKIVAGSEHVARRTPAPKKNLPPTLCPIVFLLEPFFGAPPAPHGRLECAFVVEPSGDILVTLPSIYFKKERDARERTRAAALTPNSGLAPRT